MYARLDARLQSYVAHPLAVALSGGGDSVALLEVAAGWAASRGRRLIAITVDHDLNPDSPRWSARCRAQAEGLGVGWTLCRWAGPKPSTGLPAAARHARHALIAEAARAAGVRVVLFGHTADDLAESDWMRTGGSTLGGLRDWSPSPAWPEGRGLMVARPLLDETRETLRVYLRDAGLSWIEDPANTDLRYGRSRARQALSGALTTVPTVSAASQERSANGPLTACDIAALGILEVPRDVDGHALSAALVSVAGGYTPPRGERLAALQSRLRGEETFTATLAGARIDARPDRVLLGREAGERARGGLPRLVLEASRPVVWDGRFEISTTRDRLSVMAASGSVNRLSQADRVVLKRLPPWARGAVPVLIRDDGTAPVLAWRQAEVRTLVHRRLSLALGETTQEADLDRTIHGETPPSDLFSDQH